MKINKKEVRIDVAESKGTAFDFVVRHKNKTCGFYKIVAEKDTAIIYYMYIAPEYRRQGLATGLLDILKGNFKCLQTQADASTQQSIRYLTRHGFKRQNNLLVWTQQKKPPKPQSRHNDTPQPSTQNSSPQEPSQRKCSEKSKRHHTFSTTGRPSTHQEQKEK